MFNKINKNVLYFLFGLLLGLLICFAFDRWTTYQSLKIYEEDMAHYESTEFMLSDEIDLELLLDNNIVSIETGDTIKINSDNEQIIFLNLWATWCMPCRLEMPSIESLQNKTKDQLKFYLVSNESAEKVIEFADSEDYQLPLYYFESMNSTLKTALSEGIPRTFLIYKGEIVFDHLGTAPWDSEKVTNFIDSLTNLNQ